MEIKSKYFSESKESEEKSFKLRSYRPKSRNGEECFIRNLYDISGSFYTFEKNKKLYISKMKMINFTIKKELFEKAKNDPDSFSLQDQKTIPESKFWYNRYYYFSKFDEGIMMDYESWYSVTPEEIAKYTAILCGDSIIVDAFCGSGGNVIQFSKFCRKVFAIDIDPNKITICKNNAKVYNCSSNIEYICSDFLKMKGKIKADYIFLSPPWGGTKYKDSQYYSIKELMTPNIFDILKVCFSIANKIICFFPRTTLLQEFYEIVDSIIDKENEDFYFSDIHILNSANKIKAVMLILDKTNSQFNFKQLRKYLNHYYVIPDINLMNEILNISTTLGLKKFLFAEYNFRKNLIEFEKPKIETLINSLNNEIERNKKEKEESIKNNSLTSIFLAMKIKPNNKSGNIKPINPSAIIKKKVHTHIFFNDNGKEIKEKSSATY